MNRSDGCPAPVALFAYRRPNHLRTTVDSLRANAEAPRTHLTIFCDAARKAEDVAGVDAVRAFADTVDGFASVTVVRREQNLGLAASITDGVSRLVNTHGRVIVVEDDLRVSLHFLRYMNDGLACYEHDESVASIHGYWCPTLDALPETFFLRGADCWGWATWKRAWAHFRSDGAALLSQLEERELTRQFDLDGAYPFTSMLRDQIAGRNDSWAIRWHASCFLDGMLTLYPNRSLVDNTGNDATGTHSGSSDDYGHTVALRPVVVQRQVVVESLHARAAFARFFKGRGLRVPARLVTLVKRLSGAAR
jgi:hypothetical protein